jgi:hypothetical protein
MASSPTLLVDIALSYVRLSAPNFTEEGNGQLLRDAFQGFLVGQLPRPNLVALLQHSIGTLQPLERIESILQVSNEPPVGYHRDLAMDLGSGPGRRRPRPWSPYEDTRLTAAVCRFGLDNWGSVASFVGGNRTRAQCSQRWVRGLDPRISKGQWSPEDEEQLIQFVRTRGSHTWSQISAAMGNRSDVQCRYHFFQMYREGKLPPDVAALAPERPPALPAAPALTPALRRPGEPPRLPGGARSASVGQMELSRPTGPGFDASEPAKKQKSRRGSLPAQSELPMRDGGRGHDSDGEVSAFNPFGASQDDGQLPGWETGHEDQDAIAPWTWW